MTADRGEGICAVRLGLMRPAGRRASVREGGEQGRKKGGGAWLPVQVAGPRGSKIRPNAGGLALIVVTNVRAGTTWGEELSDACQLLCITCPSIVVCATQKVRGVRVCGRYSSRGGRAQKRQRWEKSALAWFACFSVVPVSLGGCGLVRHLLTHNAKALQSNARVEQATPAPWTPFPINSCCTCSQAWPCGRDMRTHAQQKLACNYHTTGFCCTFNILRTSSTSSRIAPPLCH